jgi:hypothetical protein
MLDQQTIVSRACIRVRGNAQPGSHSGFLRAGALVLVLACAPASMPAPAADRKVEYLKEEPPRGSVPYGKVVHVDDGTCPKGEVKQITGGSQEKSIPRSVRCVKRSD